ncbi:MAG: hypothetical protein ACE5IB_05865 [Candidatus Geothermarchaeales archaeon]
MDLVTLQITLARGPMLHSPMPTLTIVYGKMLATGTIEWREGPITL